METDCFFARLDFSFSRLWPGTLTKRQRLAVPIISVQTTLDKTVFDIIISLFPIFRSHAFECYYTDTWTHCYTDAS